MPCAGAAARGRAARGRASGECKKIRKASIARLLANSMVAESSRRSVFALAIRARSRPSLIGARVLCLACGRPSLHDRSGPRLGSRRRLALAAERSHDWSRKWRHSVHWHHRRESRARLPPSLLLGSIESFQRRAAIWRLIPPAAGDLENCEEEAPQLARGRMKSSPLPSRRSLSPLRPSAFLLPLRRRFPSLSTSSHQKHRRFPSLSTSSHQKHLPETPPTGPPFPSPLSLSLSDLFLASSPPLPRPQPLTKKMSGAGPSTAAAVTKTASGSDRARAVAAKVGGSIRGGASKGAAHAVKCGSNTCTGFRDFLIKGKEGRRERERERERERGAYLFLSIFPSPRPREREAGESGGFSQSRKSLTLFSLSPFLLLPSLPTAP